MSEAHIEDRLGRIEATLASLVPLIHRIDERLNNVLPHLTTKAELTAGLSDLRTEFTELKTSGARTERRRPARSGSIR